MLPVSLMTSAVDLQHTNTPVHCTQNPGLGSVPRLRIRIYTSPFVPHTLPFSHHLSHWIPEATFKRRKGPRRMGQREKQNNQKKKLHYTQLSRSPRQRIRHYIVPSLDMMNVEAVRLEEESPTNQPLIRRLQRAQES